MNILYVLYLPPCKKMFLVGRHLITCLALIFGMTIYLVDCAISYINGYPQLTYYSG